MKSVYAALIALFVAAPLSAQTVTTYTCPIRQGPVVVATISIPVASPSLLCNQPAPVVAGTDNPNKIAFNDPANPANSCIYTDAPTGVLASLPFGASIYTGTCTADTSTGSSPVSLVSNTFTHPGIQPPALTGLKIYRD